MNRWGIDLGGTKVEGVVLDPDGNILVRNRIATEADQGYSHILGRISSLVEKLERDVGPRAARIGIGTPGAVEPVSGHMKNCNTTCLNGRPLASDLASLLGVQVEIANDADCFALAEATWGAGKGFKTVFGVIMGTGVGGGIVVQGELLEGPNGICGEWGHMTLYPDGNPCYCGRRGCVETYISGPAVERHHRAQTGASLSLAQISARAETDESCDKTIRWMCGNFGRAVAQVINIVDPQAVILGGGAGQVPYLRTWGIQAVENHVFNDSLNTVFLPPALGDSAGVIGAARLAG